MANYVNTTLYLFLSKTCAGTWDYVDPLFTDADLTRFRGRYHIIVATKLALRVLPMRPQ